MDINRIKELAGIQTLMESSKYNKDPKVTGEIEGVRPSEEIDFRRLASKMGGKNVELFQKGNTPVAVVTFEEEMWKDSNDKFLQFKKAWDAHKSGIKESEEYLEEKMTKAQMLRREEIVKAMKKDANKMKERYGEDWEKVMYATATKQAMNEAKGDGEKSEDLEDACWDGYEAVGTKKKDGKTVPNCVPVNEDHGKGFYVMVDGKEHCWCETKKEADEKAAKLKDNGKKVTVVPDKDIKESKEHEEGSDNKKATEKKGEKGSEKETEAKGEKEVKEAVVDNFVQDDTDKDNTVAKRTGVDSMMNTKVKVPAKVKDAVKARIAELEKSIEFYDDKGYNDQSQKQKAIECLQQIMDDLAPENVEALKKAQIYFGTLMSPITDLIPSQLVLFLANAEAVKEQEDKDRVAILKRHIAHHTDAMKTLDKDSISYKDHEKALERYKKELSQYVKVD